MFSQSKTPHIDCFFFSNVFVDFYELLLRDENRFCYGDQDVDLTFDQDAKQVQINLNPTEDHCFQYHQKEGKAETTKKNEIKSNFKFFEKNVAIKITNSSPNSALNFALQGNIQFSHDKEVKIVVQDAKIVAAITK